MQFHTASKTARASVSVGVFISGVSPLMTAGHVLARFSQ